MLHLQAETNITNYVDYLYINLNDIYNRRMTTLDAHTYIRST